MNLQGKTVLITGGAVRIGAVVAMKLAETGCRVIVHYGKSAAEAKKLLSVLPGGGHRIIQADLANEDEVKNLCRQAGTFELLVNSAAIFHRPDSPEDLAAAELYHKINFLAPKLLLEYFFSQNIPGGAAVNITDCFALLPGSGAYYQSKRNLNELTQKLAPAWAKRNFRINAVAPGPMIPPPWAPESRMEKILKSVPLARQVSPDDLAELVRFVLACDSMTGALIPLDSGVSAAGKNENNR